MLRATISSGLAGAFLLGACAPVAAPPGATSLGLTWRVASTPGGAEATMFESDGRRSASIRCRDGQLTVDVPRFRPATGPATQSAYLHLGGDPIALSQPFNGATAGGRPPADIGERIRNATEFRVVLGDQVIGPHIPPTGAEAEALASACEAAAASRPR